MVELVEGFVVFEMTKNTITQFPNVGPFSKRPTQSKQILIKLRTAENVHNLTFAYFCKASEFTPSLSKPPSKLNLL